MKTTEISDFRKIMIAVTVILLTMVEIVDITIVSVSLINIKGELGANPNQATWTMTSYVIAAAIVMPLAGFLSARFGRKPLIVGSAIGFGISSFLCGLSPDILVLVLFRGLQGFAGALLPVLAQSTLVDVFPKNKINKVMAFYGMALMVAPVMGPVLGGYITDSLGWRWIFFVNVPICIIMTTMAIMFLTDTKKYKRHMDWVGMGLLAAGVIFMQYVLDKGNDVGWFQSNQIIGCTVAAVFFLGVFVVRGIGRSTNIVNFTIFKDRNFSTACLIMVMACAALFGAYTWLPLWMEIVMGYTAKTAGLLTFPRGIAAFAAIAMVPILMKLIGARMILALYAVITSIGLYLFAHFSPLQGTYNLFWPNIMLGFAVGFFFVPLFSIAYITINPKHRDEASGLINFARSIGTSVGIAIFSTIMTEEAQRSWHHMSSYIHGSNPAFQKWLAVHHYSIHDHAAYAHIAQTIWRQGNMIAYIDGNLFFGMGVLLILPILFFFRLPKDKISP